MGEGLSRSKPNRRAATLTKNRVNPSPVSGICVICRDGCPGTLRNRALRSLGRT